MDLITVLVLIVIGIILLKVVGALFRVAITVGLILLIIYVIQQVVTVNMIFLPFF